MERLDEIRKLLPREISTQIFDRDKTFSFDKLQEIRLRTGQPLIMQYDNREKVFDHLITEKKEINQCLEYISEYSLYAYQEDIRQGFITVRGGHRIGVIGKAVMEAGQVKNQKHISFLNIRVAHQIVGCANPVMNFICQNRKLEHTLIISPPGCGKTTLLRDIIRQLSNGTCMEGKKVCVVDERSEIAACYEGVPQNDIGIRTDVLDCCYKANGMLMFVRSMSPEVIAIDEIGGVDDLKAIEYIINCGCVVIGTIHGNSVEEIQQKPHMGKLLGNGIFTRIIVLSKENGVGTVKQVMEI